MTTTGGTVSTQDTRERLLAAACSRFAAHGFRGVSVRDICADARANVAAVSYHFGNKEGLYLEALRHSFRVLHTPFPGLAEGRDALGALEEWIHASVVRNLAPSQPRWPAQLLWREMLDPTEAMDALVREVMAPTMKDFQKLLQTLAPSLADEESLLWSFTIMGQIVLHDFGRTPTLALMGAREYTEENMARIAAHLT
ncbi:MAG TPA: hypothetical protein DCM87_19565, partial [Planctomycetes bacterium]|nr:hypothetical protein [Planctomycetota bacterium]